MNAVLILYQGNFFSEWMEPLQKNYTESKCRVVEYSPNGYIYKTTPTPKAQEASWKREQKDSKR